MCVCARARALRADRQLTVADDLPLLPPLVTGLFLFEQSTRSH